MIAAAETKILTVNGREIYSRWF
uniref:Uncharacterized protein n=1 Tax=Anguilla anguilla TaxID=7936 RepID=A0A0E9PE36_ANGAN